MSAGVGDLNGKGRVVRANGRDAFPGFDRLEFGLLAVGGRSGVEVQLAEHAQQVGRVGIAGRQLLALGDGLRILAGPDQFTDKCLANVPSRGG